jgi:hypothetical protein
MVRVKVRARVDQMECARVALGRVGLVALLLVDQDRAEADDLLVVLVYDCQVLLPLPVGEGWAEGAKLRGQLN